MRIKSTLRAFVALALVVSGCASSPPPAAKHKFAAQTISASYDPSVSGLPGNVGDIVTVAGGATAWVKSGTGVTSWTAFPGSGGAGTVTSVVAGSGITVDATTPASPIVSVTDDWASTQQKFLKAAIPQLTECAVIKIGQYALGTTTTVSVITATSAEGGGQTASNGQNNTFGSPIFQTAKTGKFGLVARAAVGAPTSGKTAFVGLVNAAQSHKVVVGTDFATSTTKFVMELIGAGTTAVFNGSLTADTSYHDFALTGDGTTITGYEDTVMLASTATLTNVSNEPLILFVGNTTSGDSAMTKAVYCYIAP